MVSVAQLDFRGLPAAADTDAMANFASLRGPVGLNRVYADVPRGPLDIGSWLSSLKKGHTFATNGPLLGFTLGGRALGDDLRLPAGENKVKFTAWLRSFVPVDHLEVICNGRVVRELKLSGDRETVDVEETIPVSQSGWCLLRAWSDRLSIQCWTLSLRDHQPNLCEGRRLEPESLPRMPPISSPGSIA